MLNRLGRIADFISVILIVLLLCSSDNPRFVKDADRTRRFTREIEFDYPDWVWDAIRIKFDQAAIHAPFIFSYEDNKRIVFAYLQTTETLIQTEARIEQIYADPSIDDKDTASKLLREQRDELALRQTELAPFAESVLQEQVSAMLAEQGITAYGQPIPPVLYHVSRTPLALVVSPRDRIEQIANISILPTLTLDEQIELEDQVTASLDTSTLVVRIGGVGVYPTMVQETTSFDWTLSTIAHEWAHNYLNLYPLGLNYSKTPELRTMNETTANIVGDEIGRLVLQTYYNQPVASLIDPELLRLDLHLPTANKLDDPPPFDFRAEMHETRITVDEMLANGDIQEAESYMEMRRQFFWQNGYLIRKLNQAYFAFHGAYADQPGGAAGEDPVGPAVRKLREQSDSLAGFIKTIAKMSSFEELQQAIQE